MTTEPLRLVLDHLPGHRKTGEAQFEARCPAHEDARASLSVGVGEGGKVLLNCHAGCELRDILGAMELSRADLFPANPSAKPRTVAEYDYVDERGQRLFQVVRLEPKDFRQRHQGENGQWVWKLNAVRRVLYRMPEVLAAAAAAGEIWVVEGEKDVETLRALGLTATTNPGGAGKWRPEYNAAFAGAGAVYVVPDNDEPGRKHADQVVEALRASVPSPKLVQLPTGSKDVSEWLGRGGDIQELRRLAERPTPAPGPFDARLAAALMEIAGVARATQPDALSAPAFESAAALLTRDFPTTPWLVRGLLVERAVSAVAGEPKTAKTWSALELAMAVASGTKAFGEFPSGPPRQVAVFLVEDDARSTRNRLRALASGRGELGAKGLERIAVKCRGQLDLLDDRQLAWLVASCRSLPEPPAVLVLDPLRDLHAAKEDKSDEMAPVMGRLRLLRELLGCAVVFVHHAAKAGEATNARRPGQRMRGSGVVHASVDGGLYLSNLEVEGTTRFESTADVELKAVAGAGQFALRLDVVDDEGGEAVEAAWTVTRGEGAATGKSGGDNLERAQSKVLQVLKGRWLTAMGPPQPLALRMLRVQVSLKIDTVNAALAQLQAEGRAEQAFNGKKAIGWVYKPTASELPTSRQNDPHRSPEAPGSTAALIPTLYRGSTPGNGDDPPAPPGSTHAADVSLSVRTSGKAPMATKTIPSSSEAP